MRLRIIAALLAALHFPTGGLADDSNDEQLVMLQGASAPELAELVLAAGGNVTHHLHIINAVGATLTADQLTAVKESPLVTRTIDDLAALDDRGPEADDAPCRVRGHIEMAVAAEGLTWRLYNKRPEPATLESIELGWPAALGSVTAVTLDNKPLSLPASGNSPTMLITPAEGKAPVVTDTSTLRVMFDKPIPLDGTTRLRQRDFDIEVRFAAGCSDKLVPAYDNNSDDFYYNTVSGVDALHRQGVTGRGVTVAVVDSGLWEAPVLANDTRGKPRIIGRYDAITNVAGEPATDESGHGTHMTSIIAHSGPTLAGGKPAGFYKGVAPDASIVAVKILDREGLAHILEIVRGIQWVVDNREPLGIRVLNLSFHRDPGWPYWDDPVNQAVMRAWQAGIAVVAAAGNTGPDPDTVGSPGNTPHIITVGAVTDSWTPETRDDDYVPDFSSRGPTPTGHVKPDLVALGGHMTGLIAPGSAMAREQPEDTLASGEFVSSGSSQAAAFTSGVVALLLQLEPDLTPDQVKCKLTSSAEPAINADGGLAYSPFVQGDGYVSPIRAITLGKRECEDTGWDIAADISGKEHFTGPALVAEDGSPTLPGLDAVLSPLPPADGLSDTRKWGVKDHIERLRDPARATGPGMDWMRIYLDEKARMEALARDPAQ